MTKEIIIIALLLLVLYLHYQKHNLNFKDSPDYLQLEQKYQEVVKVNKVFAAFCKDEIGGQDIEEIRTKLNGRKLSEILTQNEDYELEVDTLTRTKNELEQDLLAQSNSFKSLVGEKEGIIKRLEKEKKQSQKSLEKLEQEKKDLQSFSQKQKEELEQQLEQLKNTKESSSQVLTVSKAVASFVKESRGGSRGRGGTRISSSIKTPIKSEETEPSKVETNLSEAESNDDSTK